VFQPEIREGRWVFSRQRTPNTALALTDRKVVIIEEALSAALHASPKGEPGWAFTYIPRDRVVDMTVTPGERWAELKLSLAWRSAQDERALTLDPEIASRWESVWRDA
jgi:hypothetical protein